MYKKINLVLLREIKIEINSSPRFWTYAFITFCKSRKLKFTKKQMGTHEMQLSLNKPCFCFSLPTLVTPKVVVRI